MINMELNLVCPHCKSEIPFRKPFVFTDCPECAEKLTMTKQEVEKQGVIKSNLQNKMHRAIDFWK